MRVSRAFQKKIPKNIIGRIPGRNFRLVRNDIFGSILGENLRELAKEFSRVRRNFWKDPQHYLKVLNGTSRRSAGEIFKGISGKII